MKKTYKHDFDLGMEPVKLAEGSDLKASDGGKRLDEIYAELSAQNKLRLLACAKGLLRGQKSLRKGLATMANDENHK